MIAKNTLHRLWQVMRVKVKQTYFQTKAQQILHSTYTFIKSGFIFLELLNVKLRLCYTLNAVFILAT
jgi:hypothetical protein